MDRNVRLTARLTSIAMWAGTICVVGFSCLLALSAFYRNGYSYFYVVVAVTLLTTIVAGFVFLVAISLRGATTQRWRFSLAGLFVATTVTAMLLAIFVVVLRYN